MAVRAPRIAAIGFLAALLAITAPPSRAEHETRELSGFDRLELRTGARIVIRQGMPEGIEIEAGPEVLPLIGTRVDNRTLHIQDEQTFEPQAARVTVTLRQLRGLSTSGLTQVSASGLSGGELSITGGGGSAMRLQRLEVGRLRVALGGSSRLVLDGSARELTAQLGGSAGLDAGRLDAGAAMVQGGGSARATVCVRSSLNVAIGGAASVGYYGMVKPTVAIGGTATLKALGPMPALR
ncbi:MAG: head GIN domain-containing protein [Aquincola tertiaricarbonis]|uniref:head GIN domain-containing protein n=1 Tax=Aquincola TaxID=391952 RepID=UPI00061527A7|nr:MULTISPECIES: head GIN domain-containing protein [Aquincola]MCR5866531.1 DUF2807 domain-containing protein [Aquincola sp. J276]